MTSDPKTYAAGVVGRVSAVLTLATLFLLGGTASAWADPARPTNYRSEVTSVTPSALPVSVSVVGGDAFLQLQVEPGSAATVHGYGGEPYLRFDPDGTVFVNVMSPAHYLNEDRYGQTEVPAGVSVDAEPRWEALATGGTYGWHDHRIHWMAPAPPPGIQRNEISRVLDWEVPLEVDGTEAMIAGTLTWIPSISPIPWAGAAALVAVGGLALVRSRPRTATAIGVIGGLSASVVGAAEVMVSPLGASGEVLALGPAVVALLFAVLSVVHPRSPVPPTIVAVLLAVWSVIRIPTWTMPELPTALPENLERIGVALAAGAAVALAVTVFRRVGGVEPVTEATRW